ncbi:MAG TPA: NAD(P)/FAD-dependent oxidoreductase [Pyrinomonadaceae bacterium]|nr:NAD(P)/FAD-dependent oxidoreductase [Pyrinomonadaceae bacterium]
MQTPIDAIVVGAGPNGLAAGIELARAGKRVRIYEASDRVGGGARSANLTLPGFTHDICSAVHPLAVSSPFFSELDLAKYGLRFIEPPAALAHPFDDGTAILLKRSVETTSQQLGRDAERYRKLMQPFVNNWNTLSHEILGPLRIPRHPFVLARFGLHAIRSAEGFVKSNFEEMLTRALFAGLAAHSSLALDQLGTAAFGLVLGTLGHAVGWPIPRGGAEAISNALSAYFTDLGGEIIAGTHIKSIKELPSSKCVLFDVTPRQLIKILGETAPRWFKAKLQKYRYGPGAFKMDWALDGPVPWTAAECKQSATIHLGGSLDEILKSEKAAWEGSSNKEPFVLVAQPSLFDATRAPAGKHTLWAYCHVPNGSTHDMSNSIEDQIERFAPGFRKLILARCVMSPAQLENHNPNLVGGDINGGAQVLSQMFTRPTARTYSTPIEGVYICSSSTPPGGGVHGLCGYHAARVALRKSFSHR